MFEMTARILKKPSAFVPLVMSISALIIVCAHVAIFGVVREADEGTAAHLWQLLMGLQLPIIALFAVRWLPKVPRYALSVLAVQACAVLAACAPVFLLRL